MTIKLNKNIDCSKIGVVCLFYSFFYFYRFNNTIPEHRFFVFKEEFLNNVPKHEPNENDLYIHIRSGDIFNSEISKINVNYAQPPLCFYEFIIDNFKFRKIFIISEDKSNPVINSLLNKYKKVLYLHNSFVEDVSYIINAYNLVLSTSSFSLCLARLSKNLKNLFSYDLIREKEKNHWLIESNKHNEKYIIMEMKVNDEYKSKIFPWKSSKQQLEIMLNAIC